MKPQASSFFPRAAVFDFDGVLAQSEPTHCETLRKAFDGHLARQGLPVPERDPARDWEEYKAKRIGFSDADAFRSLAAEEGVALSDADVARLIDVKAMLFATRAEHGGVADFPDGLAALRAFAAAMPVALCSGALESDTAPLLKHWGVEGCFAARVTAEETEKSKPAADPYLAALAKLRRVLPDLEAADTLAVEDTADGVHSACAAGLAVLGVAREKNAAELRAAGAHGVVADLSRVRPETVRALLSPRKP